MKGKDEHGKVADENADDVISDGADESVVAEEHAAETVKRLREKLRACEKERQEYLSGWQRAKADLINARKRDEESIKELVKFANGELIEDLISVIESFEHAMANKVAWGKADKDWRVGVEYIYSQLKKILTDRGLVEIDPLHKKFDHSLHEAVSYEAVVDEKLNHMVIEVTQKGYSLHGKLLRPAKVKVGDFKNPER